MPLVSHSTKNRKGEERTPSIAVLGRGLGRHYFFFSFFFHTPRHSKCILRTPMISFHYSIRFNSIRFDTPPESPAPTALRLIPKQSATVYSYVNLVYGLPKNQMCIDCLHRGLAFHSFHDPSTIPRSFHHPTILPSLRSFHAVPIHCGTPYPSIAVFHPIGRGLAARPPTHLSSSFGLPPFYSLSST